MMSSFPALDAVRYQDFFLKTEAFLSLCPTLVTQIFLGHKATLQVRGPLAALGVRWAKTGIDEK